MLSSLSLLIKILYLVTNLLSIISFINNINEKINLHLTFKQKKIVNKINGFYGLIGPNINM
jgi:hypothetical protein